ncbi:MAG TPA: hypothetical protein VKB96_18430 [Gammaproteobacteria bacterium]|nr:hypothetical protein [Gammaproteobacteria bacterium]
MSSQLPASLIFAHVTPQGAMIIVLWVLGLWLIGKSRTAFAPAGKGPIALQSKRSCKATLKNKKIREPKITMSVGAHPIDL